jgi:hypothetical protein
VNYLLWGLARKLCGETLSSSKISVGVYRVAYTYALDYIKVFAFGITPYPFEAFGLGGRLAWTEAGFNGQLVAPGAEVEGCDPCVSKYEGSFSWHLGGDDPEHLYLGYGVPVLPPRPPVPPEVKDLMREGRWVPPQPTFTKPEEKNTIQPSYDVGWGYSIYRKL